MRLFLFFFSLQFAVDSQHPLLSREQTPLPLCPLQPAGYLIMIEEGGGSVLIPACQSISGEGIGILLQGQERVPGAVCSADCIRGPWLCSHLFGAFGGLVNGQVPPHLTILRVVLLFVLYLVSPECLSWGCVAR
ncbi:uncharacterized protein BDV17DRAFT_276784 [Aspergillus undulatus]|uniref:uncharacterized protein n=1 Tax=Aspergillus undulatus TaxID=1810928 RepID=UPI003CCD4FE5